MQKPLHVRLTNNKPILKIKAKPLEQPLYTQTEYITIERIGILIMCPLVCQHYGKTVAQNEGIQNMQIIFSIRVNIKTTTKILHYSILLFWTVSKREVHEFMIIVCDPLENHRQINVANYHSIRLLLLHRNSIIMYADPDGVCCTLQQVNEALPPRLLLKNI